MYIITNISKQVIPLMVLDGLNLVQHNLLTGDFIEVSSLDSLINILPLLDPSLSLLEIRRDVE